MSVEGWTLAEAPREAAEEPWCRPSALLPPRGHHTNTAEDSEGRGRALYIWVYRVTRQPGLVPRLWMKEGGIDGVREGRTEGWVKLEMRKGGKARQGKARER